MCEPTTLAAAALATSAVGTGLSVTGQIKQGKAAKAAADAEAASMERQAAFQAASLRNSYQRFRGTQVTQVAKAGRAMAGSALDVMADSAIEAERDIQATLTGARQQADATRKAGRQARSMGYWNAAASGISGVSSMLSAANAWQTPPATTQPFSTAAGTSTGRIAGGP